MNCNCSSYGHNIKHIELLLSTTQKHLEVQMELNKPGPSSILIVYISTVFQRFTAILGNRYGHLNVT